MPVKKKFYVSKTIWVNFIALIAVVANEAFGFNISPEIQGGAITVINVILRAITKEEIVW